MAKCSRTDVNQPPWVSPCKARINRSSRLIAKRGRRINSSKSTNCAKVVVSPNEGLRSPTFKSCRNTINALVVKPLGSFLVCVLHVINYWYGFTSNMQLKESTVCTCTVTYKHVLKPSSGCRVKLSVTRTFGFSAQWKSLRSLLAISFLAGSADTTVFSFHCS